MTTVLFVCTENLFRSASAEFLFKKLLGDKQDSRFSVLSAGTKGTDPFGMYPQTRDRIIFYGGDPLSHHQDKLTKEIVDASDIIICMTKKHKEFVEQKFNRESYLFNQLAKNEFSDLEDDEEAYGKYHDLTDFIHHTVDSIHAGLPAIYDKLVDMR